MLGHFLCLSWTHRYVVSSQKSNIGAFLSQFHYICCIYVPWLKVIYNWISDWRRSNTIRETTQALFVLFPMLLPVANAGKIQHIFQHKFQDSVKPEFLKKLYLVTYCLVTLGSLRVRGQQIFRKSNPIPDLLFASYWSLGWKG